MGQRLAEELSGLPAEELERVIMQMEDDMRAASAAMDFEEAARLRDAVVHLRALAEGRPEDEVIAALKRDARKGSQFAGQRQRKGFNPRFKS